MPYNGELYPGGSALSTERAASPASSRGPVLLVHTRANDGSDPSAIAAGLVERGWDVAVLTCASADPREDAELVESLRRGGVRDHRWLGTAPARMAGLTPRRYHASLSDAAAHGWTARSDNALASASPGELAADIATVIATTRARLVLFPPSSLEDAETRAVGDACRHAATVMGVPFNPGGSDDAGPVGDPRRPRHARAGIGGRLAGLALAAAGGAAVGALGTVAFQYEIALAGLSLPIGLIGGLLVVAALLTGLRLLSDNRLLPGAMATGLLGIIALLSLESAGGSVLIPATPLAYYWIYGTVGIALVVLAWPKLARRRGVESNRST